MVSERDSLSFFLHLSSHFSLTLLTKGVLSSLSLFISRREYICTLFSFWLESRKKKGLGKKLMDSVWKVLLAPNHTSSFISFLSFISSPYFFSLSLFLSSTLVPSKVLSVNWATSPFTLQKKIRTKGYFKTRSVQIFNPLSNSFLLTQSLIHSIHPSSHFSPSLSSSLTFLHLSHPVSFSPSLYQSDSLFFCLLPVNII